MSTGSSKAGMEMTNISAESTLLLFLKNNINLLFLLNFNANKNFQNVFIKELREKDAQMSLLYETFCVKT